MVLSNAVIGALVDAKAALVLDETPLACSHEHCRGLPRSRPKYFSIGVPHCSLVMSSDTWKRRIKFTVLQEPLGM